MKLIQLTDLHMVPPGERLWGLEPRARLDAAVAHINAHHGDAEACIVTGDLVDGGTPAAYEALPDGGALIAIENIIDDARRENAFGLLMSLNMLIEFGAAFDFTGADYSGWCKEAGFKKIEIVPLAGPASAGVAFR